MRVGVGETYGVADATSCTGLLGDELCTEHLLSVLLRLLRTSSQHRTLKKRQQLDIYSFGSKLMERSVPSDLVYTTLEAIVKFPLSTTTSEDLSLDHSSVRTCGQR